RGTGSWSKGCGNATHRSSRASSRSISERRRCPKARRGHSTGRGLGKRAEESQSAQRQRRPNTTDLEQEMIRYIAGRLASLLFSIVAGSILRCVLFRSVPGGPVTFERQPRPDSAMQNVLRKYGLYRPFWEQYRNWVWAMLLGDFGIPFQSP